MTEQESATKVLSFAEIRRRNEEEKKRRQSVLRRSFIRLLPESTRALYVHVSHRFRDDTGGLIDGMQEHYGNDNILATYAPANSEQSFYTFDDHVESEKLERLTKPFADFSASRNIDAILYLCDSVCDGYQSPIFPDSVENKYHLWHAIRLAEQHNKQLVVGYQNEHCFRISCPEREYITNREKVKCHTSLIKVPY